MVLDLGAEGPDLTKYGQKEVPVPIHCKLISAGSISKYLVIKTYQQFYPGAFIKFWNCKTIIFWVLLYLIFISEKSGDKSTLKFQFKVNLNFWKNK